MNHSGDAAEQIVRMSLEGVEVAARITGSAAKEIALLLIAALKSPDNKGKIKLKGKERLTSMLKSGKPLEIFSVKESDLKNFMQGAKEYGIVYCVLRNTKNSPDGMCDIMVKADDAPKISRLVERFKFATVDKAKIENEIVASKAEKSAGAEPEAPDVNDTEKLLDDLLGTTEGKTGSDTPEKEKSEPDKKEPTKAQSDKAAGKDTPPAPDVNSDFFQKAEENPPLSAPTSGSRSKSARGTSSKSSVKEELREITATRAGLAAKKKKEAEMPGRDEIPTADKSKGNPVTTHKQPQINNKSKKSKGSR